MNKTHTCEHCEDEFEAYILPIEDDITAITAYFNRKREYEHLCRDCLEKYHDGEPGFEDDQ